MKNFEYSSMRAKYNRYAKINNFFSQPMIAWLLIVFPAAIGGGMFEKHIYNVLSVGCIILTALLIIYIFISLCVGDTITYREYITNHSYKATKKAIRKNKKWLI